MTLNSLYVSRLGGLDCTKFASQMQPELLQTRMATATKVVYLWKLPTVVTRRAYYSNMN